MDRSPTVWKKSARSGSESNCVELAHVGLIRDSKYPSAVLSADLVRMVAAIKAGHLDR